MTSGIFLIAFGDPCYGRAAYNLALSIKYFDRAMKIAILHDDKVFTRGGCDMSFFDVQIPISGTDISNPAKIKTSIYDLLPFDYNLILDVDALALQSVKPIIDVCIASGDYYKTFVYKTYGKDSPDFMEMMFWATRKTIKDHYKLSDDFILPATQSSIQFVKKCESSEKLFKQINENLSNPIPLQDLLNLWGGNQPDELYLNIALSQLNHTDCHIGTDSLFFADKVDLNRQRGQIQKDHYILSLYGVQREIRAVYKDWYDVLIIKMSRALGYRGCFKIGSIIENKHADKRGAHSVSDFQRNLKRKQQEQPQIEINRHLQKFVDVESTKLVETSKLIQTYESPFKRPLKITNWLNGSICRFQDKIYFAYRMESKPFCVTTKLGLCLMDENLNPIEGSSVLLNLHSYLKNYARGFHVEDPRLFIYKNELYLSYTDGYQMGQAKINPETLQAVESFYIKKPVYNRTEKNWTFFEHEGKLYSVYNTSPHVIFEMNGEDFTSRFQTEFPNEWKWGELRGGTSPVKIDNYYLSFFHSSLCLKRNQEKQYFMGAYLFEDKEPFAPKFISREPIIAGDKVNFNIPRLDRMIYVVFPGGVVRNKDSWSVCFGWNDFANRIIEVSDEFLNKNLIPVKSEIAVEV